jgi:predicted transcriptional regulator
VDEKVRNYFSGKVHGTLARSVVIRAVSFCVRGGSRARLALFNELLRRSGNSKSVINTLRDLAKKLRRHRNTAHRGVRDLAALN